VELIASSSVTTATWGRADGRARTWPSSLP